MKIELKHLAPYLPYGLKIKILNYKYDYVGVEFCTANGFYLINDDFYVTYVKGSTGKGIEDFKPILRPLSDIDKPILMSGEPNFKPSSRFDLRFHEGEWCEMNYAEYGETPIAYIPITEISTWQFKYHFDVFGLIPQGLAIDINTLTPTTLT